jgi:site-specific recombinase XerD
MRLKGLAENTQKAYILELKRFAEHFGRPAGRITSEEIQEYLLMRISEGLKPRTTNVTVAALRMLYRDVLRLPQRVESLTMRKSPDRLPDTIDERQIGLLIRSTHNLLHRTAILTAYSTGLRMSELLALRASDIDREKGMIRVRGGKGGHERLALMPSSTLEALDSYFRQIHPKPIEWVFYGASPPEQLTAAALRRSFKKACELAGIREGFRFHGLRHSLATHLFERGATRDEVQDILGHKSPQSTRVYARTTAAMLGKLDHPAQHLPGIRR